MGSGREWAGSKAEGQSGVLFGGVLAYARRIASLVSWCLWICWFRALREKLRGERRLWICITSRQAHRDAQTPNDQDVRRRPPCKIGLHPARRHFLVQLRALALGWTGGGSTARGQPVVLLDGHGVRRFATRPCWRLPSRRPIGNWPSGYPFPSFLPTNSSPLSRLNPPPYVGYRRCGLVS